MLYHGIPKHSIVSEMKNQSEIYYGTESKSFVTPDYETYKHSDDPLRCCGLQH